MPLRKGTLTVTQGKGTFTLMRNRVRELRSERGMSQAETATALGVSRQTVNAIETGRYSPSLPLAFRIARFFDSKVDDMFDASDEEVGTR